MAESSQGEKKHSPSERRRQQARDNGQVVKSQDLTSAGMLMMAVAVLYWLGSDMIETLVATIRDALGDSPMAGSGRNQYLPSDGIEQLRFGLIQLAWAVVPTMVVMFMAGILVNVTQVGLLLSPKKLMPRFSHINPFAGVKRLLSLQAVARLGFGIFKVLVISYVSYLSMTSWYGPIMTMAATPVSVLSRTLFSSLLHTCFWIGVALLILALLEYVFQWWKMEQELKMTDEEVREELKDAEGDPQMKSRRRQIQQQLAMQRISNEVPNASVVVTNPTELAIAIRYIPEEMPAPIIVAKGAGLIAQRIRRLALEHGVPIVERKPLAQVLYKSVEVGDSIPVEQYQAVAEVLRYVYQLQGKNIPTATVP